MVIVKESQRVAVGGFHAMLQLAMVLVLWCKRLRRTYAEDSVGGSLRLGN